MANRKGSLDSCIYYLHGIRYYFQVKQLELSLACRRMKVDTLGNIRHSGSLKFLYRRGYSFGYEITLFGSHRKKVTEYLGSHTRLFTRKLRACIAGLL